MSWFDSSFSFARTALSQAQRSIDKVLDIQEDRGKSQQLSDESVKDPVSTSSATSPTSEKPKTSPKFSTSTPKSGTGKSPPVTQTESLTSTPVVASPSQDSFTSTWGNTDSFWSSLTTPVNKREPVTPVAQQDKPVSGPAKQSKRAAQVATKHKEESASSARPKSTSSPSLPTRSSGKGKVRRDRKSVGSELDPKRAPLSSQQQQHSVPSPSHHGRGNTAEKQSVSGTSGKEDSANASRELHDVPLSASSAKSGNENEGGVTQSRGLVRGNKSAISSPSPSPHSPSPLSGVNLSPIPMSTSKEADGGTVQGNKERIVSKRNKGESGKIEVGPVVPTDTTDSADYDTEAKKCHKEERGGKSLLPESISPPLPSSEFSSHSSTTDKPDKRSTGEESELVEVSLTQTLESDAVNSPPVNGGTGPAVHSTHTDTSSHTLVDQHAEPSLLSPISPLPVSHSPLPTSHSPLPTSHSPLPISHSPLPISHFPLPTSHSPLPISHSPLPTSHSPLPTSHSPIPISHSPLPISHSPLPTFHSPLPTSPPPPEPSSPSTKPSEDIVSMHPQTPKAEETKKGEGENEGEKRVSGSDSLGGESVCSVVKSEGAVSEVQGGGGKGGGRGRESGDRVVVNEVQGGGGRGGGGDSVVVSGAAEVQGGGGREGVEGRESGDRVVVNEVQGGGGREEGGDKVVVSETAEVKDGGGREGGEDMESGDRVVVNETAEVQGGRGREEGGDKVVVSETAEVKDGGGREGGEDMESGDRVAVNETAEVQGGRGREEGGDGVIVKETADVQGGGTVVVNETGSAAGGPSSGSVMKEPTSEPETVQQELVQVKKLLEARETRMVEMSREMIELTEANQTLQSQLSAAEQDLRTSQGGVDDLRSEFAKRIGTTEKKLQTVIKERDSLKKQLQVLTTDHSHQRASASQELTALLKEKEEQIAGLMEEGEKLSKKELQNSNIIKKLKEKNKQNDQLLTAQRQQIEDCEREMSRLKELVKKKEEKERKYQESLSQLNSIAEQQDRELTSLKAERDDLADKARSLQANLDNTYKELSELHKVTAVNRSVAHEALLSAEQTARQELTEKMEKQRVEAHCEKEKLLLEISELRASVSRCEQQAAWREERMKQEVGDMQRRLQEAETRNQELTTSISQTTKPFLRQIETLHNAHSTQTANWEKVEASLTQRLVDAQTQLSIAVEKERSSTEKTMTLESRVSALEKQIASLRQDKSRLTAALELEKAKAETLEESQQRDSAKMEAVRASLQQSLEELRKEKEMLERQLEYERVRLEAESRKACLESQEKERLRSQLASSLSRTFSRQSSTASTTHTQSEILEKSLVREMSEGGGGGGGRGSVSTMDAVHHSRTHPTSASAMEQLQSLLKQKEGELANAQTLVSSLERSRAAMANDLAAVSSQNVDLTEKVETIPHLTTKLQELQKNNEALLQMYGEKAEEAEELKLDIQDLKDMYRQQIDDLTKR